MGKNDEEKEHQSPASETKEGVSRSQRARVGRAQTDLKIKAKTIKLPKENRRKFLTLGKAKSS